MSTAEIRLRDILVSDPVVSGMVSERVYPLILPQNPTYPSVTYVRIVDSPVHSMSGYSGLENPYIQVDCWAETLTEAKTLGLAILKALTLATTIRCVLRDDRDMYEDDPRIYRVSQDYSVWNKLEL